MSQQLVPEVDEHECDYDWFNPNIDSDDPMDEVLACTTCGRVMWTARQVAVGKVWYNV